MRHVCKRKRRAFFRNRGRAPATHQYGRKPIWLGRLGAY